MDLDVARFLVTGDFDFVARGLDAFAVACLGGAFFAAGFFLGAAFVVFVLCFGRAAIFALPPDYRGENTAIKHHPVVFYDLTTICWGIGTA